MKYVCKKGLAALITMLLVSLLAFAAFSLISGDAATNMLGTEATPETLAALREELGLNRPLLVRYGEWLAGFFTGNLGTSQNYHQPVWELLAPKVAVTVCLDLLAFCLIVLLSIPLGLRVRSGGPLESLGLAFNQLCMAVPPFFTGILLSWGLGIVLKWFQPGNFPGLDRDLAGSMKFLLLAAVSIAIPRIAMTVRMLQGTIRSELRKDYVRTSISRGSGRRAVLFRHTLKNALAPLVTFLAQTMAEIAAAGIVVEQVFGIPGLGRILVSSISNRDYPVVQAIVVILAFWVVLSNTLSDLIQQWVDPRLRDAR